MLTQRIHAAIQAQIDFIHQQQAQGLWVAPWKYPANWLAQHCLEDELLPGKPQEEHHARNRENSSKLYHSDPFWEACKSGGEPEERETNVLPFIRPKCQFKAY